MKIISIFTVTDYKTGKREEVSVEGCGQETVNAIFNHYPRNTKKIVLEEFEVDGNIKQVWL